MDKYIDWWLNDGEMFVLLPIHHRAKQTLSWYLVSIDVCKSFIVTPKCFRFLLVCCMLIYRLRVDSPFARLSRSLRLMLASSIFSGKLGCLTKDDCIDGGLSFRTLFHQLESWKQIRMPDSAQPGTDPDGLQDMSQADSWQILQCSHVCLEPVRAWKQSWNSFQTVVLSRMIQIRF